MEEKIQIKTSENFQEVDSLKKNWVKVIIGFVFLFVASVVGYFGFIFLIIGGLGGPSTSYKITVVVVLGSTIFFGVMGIIFILKGLNTTIHTTQKTNKSKERYSFLSCLLYTSPSPRD